MKIVQHKFVEFIPEQIDDGILYISIAYCTAVHKCVCGCGEEVVTPISPTDWQLTFNGETISLSPSIGNWSFSCRSHYWITNNQIHHTKKWSEEEIGYNRKKDTKKKEKFFKTKAKKTKINSWTFPLFRSKRADKPE